MRNHLRGRVVLPQLVAELRTYIWDAREAYTFEDANYQVIRIRSRSPSRQSIRWRVNGKTTRPVRGTSVIPAGMPLTLEASAGSVDVVCCMFPSEHFKQIAKIEEWTDGHTATCLSLRNTFVSAVLDRLAEEIADPSENAQTLYEVLVASLRAEAVNLVPREHRTRSQPGGLAKWQLENVLGAIDGGLAAAEMPTMDDLARSCSISVRHMMRGFKATTGRTVHQYIRQLRVERAIEILQRDLSVSFTDILRLSGFSSLSHFSAEFRKIVGITPSQYRANLKLVSQRAD